MNKHKILYKLIAMFTIVILLNAININTTKAITMNAYPMTDQEGLNTTVYTFSLVNDGTMDSNYTVYLDDLDLDSTKTRMDDSIVKYNFQKNEESATTGTISSLGTSPNRILDTGVIEKGKTIKYKLQVWMDYSADNSQQATTFSTQLRIEANQVTSNNNG